MRLRSNWARSKNAIGLGGLIVTMLGACDASMGEVGVAHRAPPRDALPVMAGPGPGGATSLAPIVPAEPASNTPTAIPTSTDTRAADTEVSGADTPTVKAADPCDRRVVSYSKPCSPDPDPCGIKSGWPGDEYCLPAPPDGEGVQIHFGPRSYTDTAETDKYVIRPGDEFNDSVLAHVPLDADRVYNRIRVQMRPGSHHWMSTSVMGKPREGFYPGSTNCNDTGGPGIGGGQNLIYDNPPQGVPAPENAEIGSLIRGSSSLCVNLHAHNFSNEPRLREIWVNLYFVDEAKAPQRTSSIAMVGGLGLQLPPGQKLITTYEGVFRGDGRIIQLFGHRHKWTRRFAAWLNDQLVYDSHSWEESVTFNYDSITTNPAIDPTGNADGAVSGILPFKSGDILKFSCFIENGSDVVLQFKNELENGEMCNLWGTTVGGGIPWTMFR